MLAAFRQEAYDWLMLQAVLFDMDGLMIDSEPIQSLSFEAILREYGVEPRLNELGVVQTIGITAVDNWLKLQAEYEFEAPMDELIARKRLCYRDLLAENITPQPGLQQLLKHLDEMPTKKAIASSSSAENIVLVVSTLGINGHFDSLISGEEVKRGKPEPDIFVEAARRLNVDPVNCIVLEDAESGIEAAAAAGMKSVAVPNRFTNSHDFSLASRVVPSLEVVTWDLLTSL